MVYSRLSLRDGYLCKRDTYLDMVPAFLGCLKDTDLENTDRRLQTSKIQLLDKTCTFDENSLPVALVFPFFGCLEIDRKYRPRKRRARIQLI